MQADDRFSDSSSPTESEDESEDWIESADPTTGQKCWYNPSTQKTTWIHPVGSQRNLKAKGKRVSINIRKASEIDVVPIPQTAIEPIHEIPPPPPEHIDSFNEPVPPPPEESTRRPSASEQPLRQPPLNTSLSSEQPLAPPSTPANAAMVSAKDSPRAVSFGVNPSPEQHSSKLAQRTASVFSISSITSDAMPSSHVPVSSPSVSSTSRKPRAQRQMSSKALKLLGVTDTVQVSDLFWDEAFPHGIDHTSQCVVYEDQFLNDQIDQLERINLAIGDPAIDFIITSLRERALSARAIVIREALEREKRQLDQLAQLPSRSQSVYSRDPLGSKSHTETLLEASRVWNWKAVKDQLAVSFFKARAVHVPHQSLMIDYREPPMFVSTAPSMKEVSFCNVHIVHDTKTYHTSVSLKKQDTVDHVIARVSRWAANRKFDVIQQEQDYVLKALGLHEYIGGQTVVWQTEYFYECLRQRRTPEFLLIPKPHMTVEEDEEDWNSRAVEYNSTVSPMVTLPYDMSTMSTPNEAPTIDWKAMGVSNPTHISQIASPFKLRIVSVKGCTRRALPLLQEHETLFQTEIFLFFGDQIVDHSTAQTQIVPSTNGSIQYHKWLHLSWPHPTTNEDCYIPLSLLPRETRCAFILYSMQPVKKIVGYVVVQLIDEHGTLVQGKKDLNLWPAEEWKSEKNVAKEEKVVEDDPTFVLLACNRPNYSMSTPKCVLTVEFETFPSQVIAPLYEPLKAKFTPPKEIDDPWQSLSPTQRRRALFVARADPLALLSKYDRELVWIARARLVSMPEALPTFLRCVDWMDPKLRQEAYACMYAWALPPVEKEFCVPLLLLGPQYCDFRVRTYAVERLDRLPDDKLQLFLLQLVQCVKNEPYHDSPLARFLLRRAIKSPFQVGQSLFWHLRSSLHCADFCERFTLMLEEYLHFCGEHAKQLRKQDCAVKQLQVVAELVIDLKRKKGLPKDQLRNRFRMELLRLNDEFFKRVGGFKLPLDPRLAVTSLLPDQCRFMSSKKVPLWLVFGNQDPSPRAKPISVIFKAGDDLRQDILTLQVIQVMDLLWLSEGLDLRMKPYKCVATGVTADGEGVGMLEIVKDSLTKGMIQREKGGRLGAFAADVIWQFLKEHNTTEQSYKNAVDTFTRSCAGYCVGTFVLGLADRHSDNIMVSKAGNLFHIDFGHFLGNFKTKTVAGIKVQREKESFVFTESMAFVMGGAKFRESPLFAKFKKLCVEAFHILRQNASTLITLFKLMVSAGMPELRRDSSIQYLKDQLCLQMKDSEAEAHLLAEIERSLHTTTRLVDDFLHNVKQM